MFQPCPQGQSGYAYWSCGYDGFWIDYPDLSNCSKIDTLQALNELNQADSVPSEVINRLYKNVSRESELGSGDIKNILDVLQVALNVQYERLSSLQGKVEFKV